MNWGSKCYTVEKEMQAAALSSFSAEGLCAFQLQKIIKLVLKLVCSGFQMFKFKFNYRLIKEANSSGNSTVRYHKNNCLDTPCWGLVLKAIAWFTPNFIFPGIYWCSYSFSTTLMDLWSLELSITYLTKIELHFI